MFRNTIALLSPFYLIKEPSLPLIYRSTYTKYFVLTPNFLRLTTPRLIGRPNDLIVL